MLRQMVMRIQSRPLFCRFLHFNSVKSQTVITPPSNHNATIIFLHGMNQTGYAWHNTLYKLCGPHIKVICPNAPLMKCSIYKGVQIPAWFNVKSLDFEHEDWEEESKELLKSSDDLQKIIDEEVNNGIPHYRIVIGGFSQGGAVALQTLFDIDKKFGGYIGLSTGLSHTHLRKQVQSAKSTNKETEMFLAHGKEDQVVDLKLGVMMKDILKTEYSNITWKEYKGMGHSTDPDEMNELATFLNEVIP